jgi:carbon monoxide dehydrogenase subunit G
MDMQGIKALAVTQQQAWDALNNPDILKACIAGCDKLEATGEGQYSVGMAVKIGPVAARFNGKIVLTEVNPPDSYTLNFEGQGGAAGFGKGPAQVQLAPKGTGSELSYTVRAQVGGKIAQLGQRLIDGVARNMAEDFFKRFDAEMQRLHPEAYAAAAQAELEAENQTEPLEVSQAPSFGGAGAPAPAARPTTSPAIPVWVWVAAAAVLLIIVVWWMR